MTDAPLLIRLPLLIAEHVDTFAWKHFRCYRRREMRKRLELTVPSAPRVRCEVCNGTVEVIMLRNGASICLACQDALR